VDNQPRKRDPSCVPDRHTAVGLWEIDANGSALWWSGSCAALHGLAADTPFSVETLLSCYSPESQRRLKAAIESSRAGQDQTVELELYCDGRPTRLRHSLSAVVVEGRVLRVSGAVLVLDAGPDSQASPLQQSQRRFDLVFDQAPIGMALVSLEGRFLAVNHELCEMLGYDRPALLRATFQELTHPDDLKLDLDSVQSLLDGLAESYRIEKRYLHREARVVHAQLDVSLLRDEEGQPLHFISQIQDISERRLNADALWESRELAQVTLASIGDGVIRTDLDGRISFCNAAAADMIDVSAESLIGKAFNEAVPLFSPEDGEPLPSPVADVLKTGEGTRVPFFTRLQRQDGRLCPIADSVAPLRDRQGELIGSVFVFHDVSVMHQMTERLAYEAMHDTLTGLPNRRAFELALSKAVLDVHVVHREHALLYLDVDHFKVINDTHGHVAGDKLLCDVARVLRSVLQPTDLLARMGGDEFAVILHDVDAAMAVARAQELVDSVRQRRFDFENHAFALSISAGLTMIDERTADAVSLMIQADTAIYVAKDVGRDRVHRFEPGTREIDEAARTMNWLQRLRSAFDGGQFELHLQCIFNTERKICGYEALIRLRGDHGELIPPGDFLPAARRLGLLAQIDEWVVENTLRLLGEARSSGQWIPGRYVAANLSARSIGDVLFQGRLLRLLDAARVPAADLVLEITETEFLVGTEAEANLLEALRSRGYKVWIDDFGSGYSSFELLKRTSYDGVKADGAFTQRLDSDPVDQALLKAICSLGKELNFPVVAEGVEDEETFHLLCRIGIQRFQGHLFHAAQPWRTALSHAEAGPAE